ncbi:hypothetical protein [Rufibacter ruber]|uniref:hypothetical protein n=1 Tax=Rufibacter ruber TaxID=1783499 RepID=UPI000A73DDF1|nr:hypothetical protein [Rufibacter ruber]
MKQSQQRSSQGNYILRIASAAAADNTLKGTANYAFQKLEEATSKAAADYSFLPQ